MSKRKGLTARARRDFQKLAADVSKIKWQAINHTGKNRDQGAEND